MKCCVKNCSNNPKCRKEGMRFFTFPKNYEVRERWIEACGNPKVATYKHATICSEHFENADYKLQVQLGFCGAKGTSQLKPDAIPTRNLPEKVLVPLIENCSNGMRTKDDAPISQEMPSTYIAHVKEETSSEFPITSKAIFLVEHPHEPLLENCSQEMKTEDGDVSFHSEVHVKEEEESFDATPTTNNEAVLLENNRVLEAQVAKLEAMNKMLTRQRLVDLEYFKKKINKMKMQEQIRRSTEALRIQEETERVLSTVFTPGQVECLIHMKKKVKWSREDVRSAMGLRNISPKAYSYLRNTMKYPLPGLSTLRMPRWASTDAIPDELRKTEEDSEPSSEM